MKKNCCNEPHVFLHRSWRSIYPNIFLALVVSLGVYWFTSKFNIPGASVNFEIFEKHVHFTLPVFLLFAILILARPLILMKDCKHEVGCHHLRSVTGILSLKSLKAEIPFEEILGVRVVQSPIQRLLDVGTIIVWTASADRPDISMKGIAGPDEKAAIISEKIDSARLRQRVHETA